MRFLSELSEQTSFLGAEEVDELAGELEALRAAIASNVSQAALKLAPLWASPYVYEMRTLLQRSLDELPGRDGGPDNERSRVLQRALRELDFPSAA